MNAAQAWNIIGIVISLAGVLLLFRYGMPYRTRTGGDSILTINQSDIKQERRYDVLGWIGLILVIVGAACQIVATLAS